ncbi:MAG TPA: ABC transporter permease [Gemmatimonadaceae bacterium]
MADWRKEVRARLAPLALHPARETEIVEELAVHLEELERDARHRGLEPAEAERVARDALSEDGALAQALRGLVRRHRELAAPGAPRRARLIAGVLHDVRFGLRMLMKRPGFTAAAVLTLALGIGGTTVIFSVVNAVLLRPLPFHEPSRLISYWGTAPEKGLPLVWLPDGLYTYLRDHTQTLESFAAFDQGGMTLTGRGEPALLPAGYVTANFFGTLGVRPALGRDFAPEEDRPNGALVVILGDAIWRTRFGGDSAIIGQSIQLNDLPTTVIGVMPPGFDFPSRSQMWLPLRLTGDGFNCWCASTVGRLRPGVAPDEARRELEKLTSELAISRRDVFPDAKRGDARGIVMTLARQIAGDVRTPLLVLLGAVALVLLIGCANVANLMLARATQRSREMAVRCCLGASAGRIRAQLLTESLLLSTAGMAAGLALALWGMAVVRRLPPDRIPRIDEVTLDPTVLAVTVGLALCTGLAFGVLPAVQAGRTDLQDTLRDGGRGASASGSRRITDAFVVAQLALSVMLLAGAALLLQSFGNLMRVDPGYRVEHTLLAQVQLPFQRYQTDSSVVRFFQQLTERVATIPGVRSVGLTHRPPLTPGNQQDNLLAEGHEPAPGEPVPVANVRYVSPEYFDAIGTPILRGRTFTASDLDAADDVVIVDQSIVDRYWPGEDGLGKRVRHGGDLANNPWLTIVGVVPTIKHSGLDETPSLQVYELFGRRVPWSMHLVIRTQLSPEAIVPAVRRHLAAVDPQLPLFNVRTMEQALDRVLTPRRLTNGVLGGFALMALALALIGVYGVVSLSVATRVREFGVRLALGATPAGVRALVMRQGLRLAVIGVVLGAVGVAWLAPALRGLLYQVRPIEPATIALVATLLIAAVAVACYLPARRATAVDPMDTLRAD